jgi:hypothetical protein
MSEGFLGRWSKRKLDSQQGRSTGDEPQQPAQPVTPAAEQAGPAAQAGAAAQSTAEPIRSDVPAPGVPAQEAREALEASLPPPPTLQDVEALTAESDFRRFAMPDVAPEVKNAALKKLFSDPRYNVMDGLDVYVGDYSKPDPMPESMVRQLAGAAFLRLFDEAAGQQEQTTAQPRDVADNPEAKTVSQSGTVSAVVSEPTDDANPDLRLQQDDAAAGTDPGSGAA